MSELKPKQHPEGFEGKFIFGGENECWEWTAAKNSNGYGNFRSMSAHVVSYKFYKGDIPKALTVDHICNNRSCVNPNHLRLLTAYDNSMRGNSPPAINKRKTHCIHGHPLEGENLYIKKRNDGPRRECKVCRNTQARKRYRKRQTLKEIKG